MFCKELVRTSGESLLSLTVEPPSFTRRLSPADVVRGSGASLQCQVSGTSPFEVTWHKDAKEIKPSSKHVLSQTNDTFGVDVQRCDAADVGEYQCTVANEVGSCTCKAWLSLKGWSDQAPVCSFISRPKGNIYCNI